MWRRKKQNKTTHTHHKTHLVDDKIKAESKFRNQRRVCVFYAPYRRTVLGKFLCFRLCLKGVCVRLCDFIPDSLSIYKENIQNDLNFIQSPCVSGTTLQYQNVNNSQCWARSVRFDKFYQFNAKTSNRSVYRIRNASTLWTFCSFIFSLSAHKRTRALIMWLSTLATITARTHVGFLHRRKSQTIYYFSFYCYVIFGN